MVPINVRGGGGGGGRKSKRKHSGCICKVLQRSRTKWKYDIYKEVYYKTLGHAVMELRSPDA